MEFCLRCLNYISCSQRNPGPGISALCPLQTPLTLINEASPPLFLCASPTPLELEQQRALVCTKTEECVPLARVFNCEMRAYKTRHACALCVLQALRALRLTIYVHSGS